MAQLAHSRRKIARRPRGPEQYGWLRGEGVFDLTCDVIIAVFSWIVAHSLGCPWTMHQKTPQPALRGLVTIRYVPVDRVRLLPPLSAFNLLDYNDEEAANKDEGDRTGTAHQGHLPG